MSKGLARLSEVIGEYADFYALIDEWMGRLPPSGPLGRVVCTRGCAACCKKLVTITIPEAMYCSFDMFERMSLDKVKVFERQCIDQLKVCRDQGIDDATKWLNAGLRCIFLDSNDLCRIYERRPVACRSYAVFDDAGQCSGPADGDVKQLDNRTAILRLMEVDQCVGRELRIPIIPEPMPLSMRWAAYAWIHGLYSLRKKLTSFRRRRNGGVDVCSEGENQFGSGDGG